jgi:Holliday junction resolvasome RuvABC endonuclease subunit
LWQNQPDRRFGLAWRAALAFLLAASIGLALAKFRRVRSKRLLLELALPIKIQDMVTRLLAVTAQNADAADALAIAIAASNEAGTAASVGVELSQGQMSQGQMGKGLSAAIAAALARDDASNGGKT